MTVRIAHFSDPHLFSSSGSRIRDYLGKRWIGGLNLLVGGARKHSPEILAALAEDIAGAEVDHLVCTGDVVCLSLPGEIAAARDSFVELDWTADRMTIVPGNHDAYTAAGAAEFSARFGDYFTGDPDWEWPDGDRWPIVRRRGRVTIIGLSSSHPTRWFSSWGRLGTVQLERLATILADPRLATSFRLVALHHPPAGRYAGHRSDGLRDHAALAGVIASHGAELILHGHEHLQLEHQLGEEMIPVHGVTSANYSGRNHRLQAAYRIYTLAAPAPSEAVERPLIAAVETRVWNRDEERFERVD